MKDFAKKPHGFATDAEWFAYEQGRADEQKVILAFIKKCDGDVNSNAGQILHDKYLELKNINNKLQ